MRNEELLEDLKAKSKHFWKFIKSLGGSTSQIQLVTDSDGNEISEPSQVRVEWMKYFRSLLNPLNPVAVNHPLIILVPLPQTPP